MTADDRSDADLVEDDRGDLADQSFKLVLDLGAFAFGVQDAAGGGPQDEDGGEVLGDLTRRGCLSVSTPMTTSMRSASMVIVPCQGE